jgi:hypothetical protein
MNCSPRGVTETYPAFTATIYQRRKRKRKREREKKKHIRTCIIVIDAFIATDQVPLQDKFSPSICVLRDISSECGE